jgi:predicted RND superfamily exporter protein
MNQIDEINKGYFMTVTGGESLVPRTLYNKDVETLQEEIRKLYKENMNHLISVRENTTKIQSLKKRMYKLCDHSFERDSWSCEPCGPTKMICKTCGMYK